MDECQGKRIRVPFPPLLTGIWLERPHRFAVKVRLDSGEEVFAHTNNSGSMKSCSGPGLRVAVSYCPKPGNVTSYRLHAVELEHGWAGVDTSVPPALVKAMLESGGVGPIRGYRFVRREVALRPGSRLDLQMERPDGEVAYGEVKNVTLWLDQAHRFPDARSERATKHVTELAELACEGIETWVFFVIQRPEQAPLAPADAIDPVFGKALRQAVKQGLNVMAIRASVGFEGVWVAELLPVDLSPPATSLKPGR